MKPHAPKTRLLKTATDLFYQRGFHNVGINEVTDTANVARMTLYNNFASKEALAIAAFQKLAQQRQQLIAETLDGAKEARSKILALFDLAENLRLKKNFAVAPSSIWLPRKFNQAQSYTIWWLNTKTG
jgi:AcrR family transcriptional regulator